MRLSGNSQGSNTRYTRESPLPARALDFNVKANLVAYLRTLPFLDEWTQMVTKKDLASMTAQVAKAARFGINFQFGGIVDIAQVWNSAESAYMVAGLSFYQARRIFYNLWSIQKKYQKAFGYTYVSTQAIPSTSNVKVSFLPGAEYSVEIIDVDALGARPLDADDKVRREVYTKIWGDTPYTVDYEGHYRPRITAPPQVPYSPYAHPLTAAMQTPLPIAPPHAHPLTAVIQTLPPPAPPSPAIPEADQPVDMEEYASLNNFD